MKYHEKALKIKEIIYKIQQEKKKWKNLEDLEDYLKKYNSRIKNDKRRRKGFLVSHLYNHSEKSIVLEVPNDLAEKIMVFSDFP